MRFDTFMLDIDFNICDYDNYVYFKVHDISELVYLLLYMLIVSKSKTEIYSLKNKIEL